MQNEVVFKVDAIDCKESNMFLRKLYDCMEEYFHGAWEVDSYKVDANRIHVGYSGFGEVLIEYKVKGIIDKIIIVNDDKSKREIISKVLLEVNKTYRNSLKNYVVTVTLVDNDYKFPKELFVGENDNDSESGLVIIDSAFNNISCSYNKEIGKNIIKFNIQAYGQLDAKYVYTQKINFLTHLLSLYTKNLFLVDSGKVELGTFNCKNNVNSKYNNEWIDQDEIFISFSELMLGRDFYEFFSLVLSDMNYDKDFRLILNSIQQMYIAYLLRRNLRESGEYRIPGYVDLVNAELVSSLEPLSNIGAEKPQHCPECGNLVYSIRKKVKDLCEKYMPDHITKLLADDLYGLRSKYLHEGDADTNEFYMGRSFPQLDPVAGNRILMPVALINENAFDYVSYIIRRVIEDKIKSRSNE